MSMLSNGYYFDASSSAIPPSTIEAMGEWADAMEYSNSAAAARFPEEENLCVNANPDFLYGDNSPYGSASVTIKMYIARLVEVGRLPECMAGWRPNYVQLNKMENGKSTPFHRDNSLNHGPLFVQNLGGRALVQFFEGEAKHRTVLDQFYVESYQWYMLLGSKMGHCEEDHPNARLPHVVTGVSDLRYAARFSMVDHPSLARV